jgi:hypothetical protein
VDSEGKSKGNKTVSKFGLFSALFGKIHQNSAADLSGRRFVRPLTFLFGF